MKLFYYYIILTFIFLSPIYSQGNFQLGVNLDDNGAFVNIINHTNRFSNVGAFDSYGFPKTDFDLVLMDGRPVPEWNNTIDDPEKYRVDYSGRYKCSFIGSAQVTVSGTSVSIENKTYDSQTNICNFELVVGGYPNANHGLVFLSFKDTKRTSNDPINSGITKLKVNRPGYELNSTKIFTDDFLNLCKSADFACYRFYNLQNIWDGEPIYPTKTKWENRKTPNDVTQKSMAALNNKRDGWCWEYIVELSNILKKDIWINIHMSCDSIYVSSLANFLKEKLDPTINIYVENSNEVWSPTQASHGPYNKSEADFYGVNFDQNYARRTVELSNWFADVFGKSEINKKVRVILAGQHAYNGRSDNHLNYIKNTFGEPKNYIYATSTALYFQSTKSSSTDPLVINDGMVSDISSQISDTKSSFYRLNHINKAKSWGFVGGSTSYEGGPHLPSGGGTTNLDAQILAHRTSNMKDILKFNYLEGWKNIGGGLAMYFTLSSGYNRYGCWGITDDITKPDRNSKMQAMREIISGNTDVKDIYNYLNFKIYPNPVSDYIEIENRIDYGNIEIFDSMGIKVMNIESTEDRIDISNLSAGLYFVKSGNLTGKFIKN